MSLIPVGAGRRRPTGQEAISLELVSGLLIIIGLAAVGLLFYAIATDDGLREATQGPEIEGIGVEIFKRQPPESAAESRFRIGVEEESPAANSDLQGGDILLSVGGEAVDPSAMTADDVNALIEDAYQAAVDAGQDSLAVTVRRGEETITVDLPLPDSVDQLGLNVEFVPAQATEPYFEMRPINGGPADSAGIQAGDRLIQVDDTEITPDMTLDEVRAIVREEDVALSEDDFEIGVTFLRVREDGTLTEDERVVPKNVAPTATMAFLDSFGIVIPLIVLGLAFMFVRIGLRLRQYDVVAARWALVLLLWLIVFLIIATIWQFWVQGKGGLITQEPFDFGEALLGAIPLTLAIIPIVIAYIWLSNFMPEVFQSDESITSRNTRFAWTLLVPTLVVLALIAARPLEQTFIKSLTDDEFGTNKPVRFVGLDNYQQLLSFKFTTVECRTDESGECQRSGGEEGKIVWERSSIEAEEAQRLREMSSDERQNFTRYQEAQTWKLPSSDTGLRLLGKDPIFLKAFGNTLQFTFFSVILELILGMIIALVVNSKFAGRGLMRTAMLVPWAIPTVVAAVLWQTMMRGDQTGIINKFLIDIGILSEPEQWFSATGPWMASIVAVDVWKTAPFMALLLLAGLQTISGDIYEAAQVDGAGKVRQFFSITLPLLRPTIAVALIFRTLDALRAFDVFQVLLDSTRPSLARYNYDQLVLSRMDGYASAVGVIIFVLILIFTVIYVRFVGIEQE